MLNNNWLNIGDGLNFVTCEHSLCLGRTRRAPHCDWGWKGELPGRAGGVEHQAVGGGELSRDGVITRWWKDKLSPGLGTLESEK